VLHVDGTAAAIVAVDTAGSHDDPDHNLTLLNMSRRFYRLTIEILQDRHRL